MEAKTKRNHMRFQLLIRLAARMTEVAARPDMTKEALWVYNELAGPAADAFCKSHEAVIAAESTVAEKKVHVQSMQDEFEGVFRTARSIVLAFLPAQKLPDTFSAQRTDTDKLGAVATLLSVVKAHASAGWAAEIMAGEFGTLAPEMEAALKDLIAANDALEAARNQRIAAYRPAYKQYLAFKRVVRNLLGSSSRAYRRLHLRKAGSKDIELDESAEETAPDSGVLPASKGTPAPGEPLPVKIA